MPKNPRLTPSEAESLLLESGFILLRCKGSHRIYQKNHEKIVIPFHQGKILHPKIVKQVIESVEEKD